MDLGRETRASCALPGGRGRLGAGGFFLFQRCCGRAWCWPPCWGPRAAAGVRDGPQEAAVQAANSPGRRGPCRAIVSGKPDRDFFKPAMVDHLTEEEKDKARSGKADEEPVPDATPPKGRGSARLLLRKAPSCSRRAARARQGPPQRSAPKPMGKSSWQA